MQWPPFVQFRILIFSLHFCCYYHLVTQIMSDQSTFLISNLLHYFRCLQCTQSEYSLNIVCQKIRGTIA